MLFISAVDALVLFLILIILSILRFSLLHYCCWHACHLLFALCFVFSDEHNRTRKEELARAAVANGGAGGVGVGVNGGDARGFPEKSMLAQYLKNAPHAQLAPESNASKLAAALLTFGMINVIVMTTCRNERLTILTLNA